MMKIPTEVKPIIEELMESPKFKKRWAEHLIQSKWEDWVGKRIAQHIRPKNLENDQLTVIIDDERWANSFDAFKDKILGKMEKDLGSLSIKGFNAVMDKKIPAPKRPKKSTKQKAQKDQKAQKKDPLKIESSGSTQSLDKEMEKELSNIKDPAIRDALRRLIKKALSSKQK